MWRVERAVHGTPVLNTGFSLAFDGRLDRAALDAAVRALGARHELLHTGFDSVDGQLFLRPADPRTLALLDVSASSDVDGAARQTHARVWNTPFPFDGTPLLRAVLIRLGAGRHLLTCVVHPLIADGKSIDTLREELALLYNARVSGRQAVLRELSGQYYAAVADGVHRMPQDIAFWRTRLDALPELTLPGQLPTGQGSGVVHGRYELSRAAPAILDRFCRQERSTPFVAFATVLLVLTYLRTGQRDLRVGAVWDTRGPAAQSVVGPFEQGLVIRVDLGPTHTFAQAHDTVRSSTFEAMSHQCLPFDRLVDMVEVGGLPRQMFLPLTASFQEPRSEPPAMHGVVTAHYEEEDLNLGAADGLYVVLATLKSAALQCSAVCDGRLLDQRALDTFLAELGRLVEVALARPRDSLAELATTAGIAP